MASYDRQIKADNGDLIYPKTRVSAILDFDTEAHIVNRNQSAGVVQTPTFTDNLNGTFNVSAFTARVFQGAGFAGDLRLYNIAGGLFTPVNNALNYLVVDYNSGSPIARLTTDVESIDESAIIPVSTIYRHGTHVHHLPWDSLGLGLSNKLNQRFVKTQRFARETGLIISEYPTRGMRISAGKVWYGAVRQSLLACDSAYDHFHLYYHVAGVYITESIHIAQYNNTQYDDGTNLQTTNPNKFLINWIYRGIEEEAHAYVVLGNAAYGTLAEATAAQPRADLPDEIKAHAILVGKIIVVRDGTTAASILSAFDLAFTQTGGGGGTTVHNDLSGLQGGQAAEYYHLTLAQHTDLTDGGDSTSHYHATDRARANHTGTQSADTLTDGTTNKAFLATERTKLAGIATGAQVNNISDVNATDLTDGGDSSLHYHSTDRNRANHTGTQSADTLTDGTTNKAFLATERTKLAGIATGAQVNNISDVNATDLTDGGDSTLHYHATDRNRANHTGTQSADTIVDGTTNKAYTATEKTKLAGIETGATADMTAAEILTAIKTVDGSGSGLDGDQLDAFELKGGANSISTDGIMSNVGSGLIGDTVTYYKNSTTTLTSNVETHIAIDTLSFNTNTALYTMASGVITVKKAGIYLISGFIRINSGTVGSRVNTHIWVNATAWSPVSGGTQYILGSVAQVASQPSGAIIPIVLKLNANDTITLSGYAYTAGATVGSALTSNSLSITKLA